MERIAEFSKVSSEIFTEQACERLGMSEEQAKAAYAAIKLPKRATAGSAGYDFYLPCDLKLAPGETISIPTGIRAKMDIAWVLMIFPRSGLGFKYRLQLDNTVGIIDSDYYYSDNEGHIIIKLTNCSNTGSSAGKTIELEAGKGFAQGVFLQYGITIDDAADGIRNGGFGSTSK
ncbi:MAG: deoxyuridine 5'-triphosphate nucleotidohydrolase [Lachnospiraceae bacterium]|nr:deoxyuridine 5'-triphosphate nucleotidohydrolase [Lachnospiraceae bacterium]